MNRFAWLKCLAVGYHRPRLDSSAHYGRCVICNRKVR